MDLARLFIEHGADVTAQDKGGSTPLHWAVQGGWGTAYLARPFVKHITEPTPRDSLSRLEWRKEWGKVDLARFLIEHGADVSAKDKNGLTPLHWAVQGGVGNVDLARLLVEHGADATAWDNDRSTPLHWLVKRRWGKVDFTPLLDQQGDGAIVQNWDRSIPRYSPSRMGHMDLARLLVEYGADTTAKDKYGLTPVHLATLEGREDLARVLVEHGAQSNHYGLGHSRQRLRGIWQWVTSSQP
jgi:ankyrin repeat protein